LAQKKAGTITALCRQLGFSKQAYYKGLAEKANSDLNREAIRHQVLALKSAMPQIGGRKVHYLLKKRQIEENWHNIGRDSLFRLLREEDLLVKRKRRYVKTTDSRHWMRRFPNLIKELDICRPEQVWVADITYITLEEGFCFLHLVTDAYSKRVMGYHVSNDMSAASTATALKMAISARRYKGPLIHHSDRGLQYQSNLYVEILNKSDILISTTQDSSPYDNAIAERINGILKHEFEIENLEDQIMATRLVKEAVSTYNQLRPHLSNHMLTPNQMHLQCKLERRQWSKKVR
jgi:putative transposase